MFDLHRFMRFDAKRTLMLTTAPLSRREALGELPGELIVSDERLAEHIGLESVPPEVMNARSDEWALLEEGELWRLWRSPTPTTDGRTIFISPVDALPDVSGAPDWGLASSGFLVAGAEALGEWTQSVYGWPAEDFREAVSRFLSIDVLQMDRAVELVDLASGAALNRWPILHDNPLRALQKASESYPEVRFCEEDFEYSLKADAESSA